MSIRSIVLRALLGLSLVLNGTGTAVAAVQMGAVTMASHAMASGTPPSAATADADCHDQGLATEASIDSAVQHDATSNPHPSPDCCKYGACQCTCAQHVQVAMALITAEGPVGVIDVALHALANGRPAPVPDALLRPPIA